MKRHTSLAILSREHHSALILAQLLKKNAPQYRGLPADTDGKIIYAMKMFHDSLQDHFRKEELLLEKVKQAHVEVAGLAEEIVTEHKYLATSFLNLSKNKMPEAEMDKLGNALETHIRKEERILFPLLQECCSEKELGEIGSLLL